MALHQCELINKIQLSPTEWRFDFKAPALCDEAEPGQFVMIKCGQDDSPFLRRAISINQCHEGVLSLMFAVVGEGTKKLAACSCGEYLSILGPLGHGFDSNLRGKKVAFIGGGIGKAPFEFLADRLLAQDNQIIFVVGGRSAANLEGLTYFENKEDVTLLLATEDGSVGVKGYVSHYYDQLLDCDRIYACGPTPMLQSVQQYFLEKDIPCQLSLEGKMACGVGVCLGCTCQSAHEDATTYPKVCQDGPVFWAKDVKLTW